MEQSVSDTSGLSYSYANLAGILANHVSDIESLIFNREKFISNCQKSKSNNKRKNNDLNDKKNIKLFISYSQKDRKLKSELLGHLSLLSTKHNLSIWSDDNLLPGDLWGSKIQENLINSDIVLLLISPDYLNSKFTEFELKKAMDLNKRIVPIILREADIMDTTISRFLVLPRNMEPLNNYKNRDLGFEEVTNELEKLLISLKDEIA